MQPRAEEVEGMEAERCWGMSERRPGPNEVWELRLYVAGRSAKSLSAFENLKRICEEHLAGRYEIEVVDLVENPELAASDQIVAIPTLVRKLPEPLRKIVGDLRNTERTLVGLQLRPAARHDSGARPVADALR